MRYDLYGYFPHFSCFNDFFGHVGYTLEEQRKLFDNIKPLFANKPLLVVANKSDVWRGNLDEGRAQMLEDMRKDLEADGEGEGKFMEMSNKDDDDSVMAVKLQACDMLLQYRVEQKFKSKKVRSPELF